MVYRLPYRPWKTSVPIYENDLTSMARLLDEPHQLQPLEGSRHVGEYYGSPVTAYHKFAAVVGTSYAMDGKRALRSMNSEFPQREGFDQFFPVTKVRSADMDPDIESELNQLKYHIAIKTPAGHYAQGKVHLLAMDSGRAIVALPDDVKAYFSSNGGNRPFPYFEVSVSDLIDVILLCGGDKGTQEQDIQKAKKYWTDYRRRDDAKK